MTANPTQVAVTWELLGKCEPQLLALERLIKAVRADPGKPFCANQVWYRGAKPLLLDLVGWHRGYPQEASDPTRNAWKSTSLADLLDQPDRRMPPADEWERLMRSVRAYDVAYEYLYELLPNCRDCICL